MGNRICANLLTILSYQPLYPRAVDAKPTPPTECRGAESLVGRSGIGETVATLEHLLLG